MDWNALWQAVVTSAWAGAGATGVGALPALAMRSLGERSRAVLGGFSGGVMLAATFFSLLSPGLDEAVDLWGKWGGLVAASAAFGAGICFVALMHCFLPHEHFEKGRDGAAAERLARTWLFVLAITIHNFPEGLAVGVGAASGESSLQLPIALGIAFQNAPEGLVVAVSLMREGYGRGRAIAMALATGLVEPIGAACGALGLGISHDLLPLGLSFSAGAMLFVIQDEVLPEAYRGPHPDHATMGAMVGFVLMMVLDVAFAS